ncbi:MAG: ferrous iron transport protein A [Clostridia bacterium]|nr:ferrous iron transport protein A [Clostridia bacterium]
MGGFLFKRKNKSEQASGGIYALKQSECGKITKIDVTGNAAVRLSSLGITVGKKITVLSFSLFKSSVLIGCGAVRLGLRKSLAVRIEVEKCVG